MFILGVQGQQNSKSKYLFANCGVLYIRYKYNCMRKPYLDHLLSIKKHKEIPFQAITVSGQTYIIVKLDVKLNLEKLCRYSPFR